MLPPLLIALWEAPWSAACGTAFATLILLVLQPDAAQAACFCAAWIWLAAARRDRSVGVVVVASLLIAGAALLRPDPLEPVAHVEGIVRLAASQGTVLAGTGLLALAALPLAPALLLERRRGIGLAIYLAGTLVAAWLGDFPVPVMGYGVSPILGYYGAVAMYIFLGRPSPAYSTATPAA